jgi:hypothetical protein
MGTRATPGTELVLKNLKAYGLLLETDPKLPSAAGLVVGGEIRGSWWAHPRAQEVFAVLQQLADHKDVLITKLISGKVTFVHRKLWPDVLAVGMARENWQLKGLSPAARTLLKMVDQSSELRSDHLAWPPKFKAVKPGQAVRELEKRLLIHSEELHTEGGSHAKQLATWQRWAERNDCLGRTVEVADAKRTLEQRLSELNERFGTSARLPWMRTK